MSYHVQFGNRPTIALKPTDESLSRFWRRMLNLSKHVNFGDASLYHCGIIVRSVWNMETKLSDKGAKYRCFYKKY